MREAIKLKIQRAWFQIEFGRKPTEVVMPRIVWTEFLHTMECEDQCMVDWTRDREFPYLMDMKVLVDSCAVLVEMR